MAWLWSSWEEYIDYVQPIAVKSRGLFILSQQGSWFDTEQRIGEAVRQLTDTIETLNKLGFTEHDDMPLVNDQSVINKAKGVVAELVHAGEELLLYHTRLAKSGATYNFLHQREILENWEGYSDPENLSMEVEQLISDTKRLLTEYYEMREADGQFITLDLHLPPELKADFLLARNLFSVGFDEVGVLISGRGLEGVLRKIAQVRKIIIEVKGKSEPAYDCDVYDLIELMHRLRWKATKERLITQDIKALLHYLRALRNGGAHASLEGRRPPIGPRETAKVVAETANRLWKDVTSTRARFQQTTIQKVWQ